MKNVMNFPLFYTLKELNMCIKLKKNVNIINY